MLSADEAEVYEEIATLEFIGPQVTAETLVTASDLDEDSVLAALRSLGERGVICSERRGGALVYMASRLERSSGAGGQPEPLSWAAGH
jgi:hypothetical protein